MKKQLERVQLKDTQIDVIMPEKVLNQIKYLCREIHAVEWSGILYYTIDGSIKDPGNMKLTLQTILPMHKGSGTYTEYAFDERVIDFMMENPDAMEWKMAHIHSHNNMAVYFSGTDWSELEDNAPNHNFYLSLIVNNRMDFCAKVCFIAEPSGEVTLPFTAKDENGNVYEYSSSIEKGKDKLVVYDCNIVTPELNKPTEDFTKAVDFIIKKAEKSSGRGFTSRTTKTPAWTPRTSTVRPRVPDTPYRFIGDKVDRTVTPSKNVPWYKEEREIAKTQSSTFTGLAEVEEEIVEDFSMFCLNSGTTPDPKEFEDLEDVINQYKSFNLSEQYVITGFMDKYNTMYTTFFSNNPEVESESFFINITSELIEEFENEALVTKNEYVSEVLEGCAKGLTRLLDNFIKM